jgi:hypothetical protein
MINKLRKAFKVVTTWKDVDLEDALKAKTKLSNLETKLHQTQMYVRQDALLIQTLEFANSNFVGMQNQLDKSLIKNEEY